MAATLGLPDEEINRLLAEAEARLAGNADADARAVAPAKSAALKPLTVAAPAAPKAGEQTVPQEKKAEELSVRVPQLSQKKKVRGFLLFTAA